MSISFASVAFSFLKGAISIFLRGGAGALLEAATEAVDQAETEGGSGPEKLASAQKRVISKLESVGITVNPVAVNAAIEAAVANKINVSKDNAED